MDWSTFILGAFIGFYICSICVFIIICIFAIRYINKDNKNSSSLNDMSFDDMSFDFMMDYTNYVIKMMNKKCEKENIPVTFCIKENY